jgi:hypothetical protein
MCMEDDRKLMEAEGCGSALEYGLYGRLEPSLRRDETPPLRTTHRWRAMLINLHRRRGLRGDGS